MISTFIAREFLPDIVRRTVNKLDGRVFRTVSAPTDTINCDLDIDRMESEASREALAVELANRLQSVDVIAPWPETMPHDHAYFTDPVSKLRMDILGGFDVRNCEYKVRLVIGIA